MNRHVQIPYGMKDARGTMILACWGWALFVPDRDPFYVVNNYYVTGAFLGYQLQTELILDGAH